MAHQSFINELMNTSNTTSSTMRNKSREKSKKLLSNLNKKKNSAIQDHLLLKTIGPCKMVYAQYEVLCCKIF